MDARTTAVALLAFSDFVEMASNLSLGRGTSVETNVRGFSEGSLDFDLVFHVIAATTTLASGGIPPAEAVLSLIRSGLQAFKDLEGRAPTRIEQSGDNSLAVSTDGGDVNIYQSGTMNFVLGEKAGEAVKGFIFDPLKGPAQDMRLNHEGTGEVVRVDKEEADYFQPIDSSETIVDVETRMALRIETIHFKEGNKWRFSNGVIGFWAEITDPSYGEAIKNNRARFGRGDILVAQVRTVQKRDMTGALDAEYFVTKIEKHEEAPRQGELL